jgi:hypothetical protein
LSAVSGWFKLATHTLMWTRDVLIGLVGPIVSLWLLAILVRHRLYREFPFFVAYVVAVIAVTALRLWMMPNYPTFFKVYWVTECVYAVLALLALHEVFHTVFNEFYEIWPWFWLVFPAAVGLFAWLKISDGLHHPPAQAPPIVALVLSAASTVSWVQMALFGLMCALVWLVGNWEYYPVGIVNGFAVLALGSWAAYASVSGFGTKFNVIGKYGPPLAYFIAVLVWLGTFLRPPRPDKWEAWSKTVTPQQISAEVQEYLKILKGKRSQ